ncbi:hypothetical protein FGIG_00316 [Fasciola gigantica]|uniref:Peptidase M13 N-terminal domain-containing protein n=1 Tax=Fasciola gigantica TaxID=46835 RepID=A0A504YE99_FASGI|nr:hypothetical protein FGIG_00316 [Fasciola gigantica]
MTQFFSRSKKSVVTNSMANYSSYSGPSLMLASSQIRNGLLDSSTLTNSEFFCDLSKDGEDKNEKNDRWGRVTSDLPESEMIDGPELGTSIKASLKPPASHLSTKEKSNKLKRYKNLTDGKDTSEGHVQLLNASPIPESKNKTVERGTIDGTTASSGRDITSDGTNSKIETGLTKLKSSFVHVGGSDSTSPCAPPCLCGTRMKIIIIVTVLGFLVTLSVVILCLAFTINRPKSIAEPVTEVAPTAMPHTIQPVPKATIHIPERVCFNASCLRVASVIAERLELFNSPQGFAQSRGSCAPSDLFRLTKILAYGDRPGYFVEQTSVGMMQKRLLHSIWSSISEALQNITPSRYVPVWIKKLSFLYRVLLTRGISMGAVTSKHSSELAAPQQSPSTSLDSLRKNEKNIITNSEASPNSINDHLTLEDLLQRGNIAFHGLDNVLISVQLELRVPLFFSTWISTAHNPGLLDTRIPVINIPRYLGAMISRNQSVLLPRDLAILVTDLEYFKNLGALLSQTPYSDLQEYVTFSILHKYASYVDDLAASLKKKLLKPIAERFGMQHMENWPLLLDLASPGLKALVLQQWSMRNLERSADVIQADVFRPLQEEFKAMASLLITDKSELNEVLSQLNGLRIRFTESSFKNKMEDFYDPWQIKLERNLLSQVVEFHQFMSMKALKPDYALLLGDCGLSSEGQHVSMYLRDENIIGSLNGIVKLQGLRKVMGNTHDQDDNTREILMLYHIKADELSSEEMSLITSVFVAMEAVGRLCRKLDGTNQLSKEPRLSGVDLPRSVTFYLWLFQSICEAVPATRGSQVILDECTAARIAAHMSPTFRDLISCPDAHKFPNNGESGTRVVFGQKSF